MVINVWTLPLTLLGLVVGILLVGHIDNAALAFTAAANALICIIGITKSISGGLRPVAAVFFIFTFSWLGIAPAAQISTGNVAWGHPGVLSDSSTVQTALLMNIVASLAFLLGTELARNRNTDYQLGAIRDTARVRPRTILAITLLLLVVAPYAISANGGLSTLFSSRAEASGARSASGLSMDAIGGAHYAVIHILPGALAVTGILLIIYEVQRRRSERVPLGLGLSVSLVIMIIGILIFANPLAHSRFTAAVAFGSVALALIKPRSKLTAFLFAGAMLTATLLIYPLANALRSSSARGRTGINAFTGPDFDGFQQVINTLDYVNASGHTYGSHILSGIGFFIPRSIWSGKADPASYEIASHAGYTWTNLSLPIHAEFYLEFSWPGVLLGMALFGYLAGCIDHAWLHFPTSKLALFAPYVSIAILGIVRGPIGAQVPVWGAAVILLWIGIRSGKSTSTSNPPNLSEAWLSNQRH